MKFASLPFIFSSTGQNKTCYGYGGFMLSILKHDFADFFLLFVFQDHFVTLSSVILKHVTSNFSFIVL